ncbi:hypothetical protein CTAYLR_008490 [Chrysophaeum taylorii]|uniref:Anoctamin transmembrane domain-containing protein n=1 Tax=Chrysophaeum taylorii TaxID=2483200 RepID=A0AAD7XK58_9STRA|nr:hypothetical protein CTAYLR_008490 [Chrysophaeum taylorii]
MVLNTEQDLILWEVVSYLLSLVLMACSLRLLLTIARQEMRPRPMFTKNDALFTDYEIGQNWSWDWVFVFAVGRESTEEDYTLKRVIERLDAARLETKMFRSADRSKIFVKIRATSERLKDEAARIEYKLLLAPSEVKRRIQRGFRDPSGYYKWYPRKAKWTLEGKTFDTAIVDTKRQSPYSFNDYIYGKYEKESNRPDLKGAYKVYYPANSIFRGVDRLKLIQSIMEADTKNYGANINLNKVLAKHAILAAFPLHHDSELYALQDKWLNYKTAPWKQPIDAVKDYFGEKIGLYFLFLGHYTTWLCAAACVGSVVTVVNFFESGGADAVTPLFAVFTSLWATLYLESWKNTQAKKVMMWGMTDFETQEQTRPEFEGLEIHSPVHGMPVLFFSRREQLRAYVASYLVVCASLVGVLAVLAAAFTMQAFIANRPIATHLGSGKPLNFDGRRLGLIVSHVVIALTSFFGCDTLRPVATRLNELENHRTETQFEDNLIAKVFIFRFVISYGPLFYISVLQQNVATTLNFQRLACYHRDCFSDVSSLLATTFIVRVLIGNFAEVVGPSIRQWNERRKRRRVTLRRGKDPDALVRRDLGEYQDPTNLDLARKRQTSPTEEQYLRDEYHHLLGTFDDYAEMITQFGYTTLFATAFPLGPLFAAVNNYIEIRFDGWKLLQNTRRPWPTGAEDIGTWETVLSIMSILATLTNSFLVTYTGSTFENQTLFSRLLLFTVFEYSLLGVKLVIMIAIDDTPPAVKLQIDRASFLVSKIILNERDEEKDLGDDVDEIIGDMIHVHNTDPDLVLPEPPSSSDAKPAKKDQKQRDVERGDL